MSWLRSGSKKKSSSETRSQSFDAGSTQPTPPSSPIVKLGGSGGISNNSGGSGSNSPGGANSGSSSNSSNSPYQSAPGSPSSSPKIQGFSSSSSSPLTVSNSQGSRVNVSPIVHLSTPTKLNQSSSNNISSNGSNNVVVNKNTNYDLPQMSFRPGIGRPSPNTSPGSSSPSSPSLSQNRRMLNGGGLPPKSPVEKMKQNARKRGVTVASESQEEAESRRISLVGAIDPLTRPRSRSVEVLNSWDYQPWDYQDMNQRDDEYVVDDLTDDEESISLPSSLSSSTGSLKSPRTLLVKQKSNGNLIPQPINNTNTSSSSLKEQQPSNSISNSNSNSNNSLLSNGQHSPNPITSVTGSLSLSSSNLFKSFSLNTSIRTSSDDEGGSSPRVANISGDVSLAIPSPILKSPSQSNLISKLIFEKNEENKFAVVSGPTDQLMEHLCNNNNKSDLTYVYSFILSFHYFIKPNQLFDFLVKKFESSISQSTSSSKVHKHFEEIQASIRQNIIIVFLVWIESNFTDFMDDLELHTKLIQFERANDIKSIRESLDKQSVIRLNLNQFAEQMKGDLIVSPRTSSSGRDSLTSSGSKNNNNQVFTGLQLQEYVSKTLEIGNHTADYVLQKLLLTKKIASIGGGTVSSKSKVQKDDNYFFAIAPVIKESYSKSILDYHPHDIAKQLTMIEFNIFQQIKLKEVYFKNWTNAKTKFEMSPNVMALINMSNKVANWVATEVVTTPHPKKRIEVLKRFVTIAEYCKKINSYNTLMEIVSGLNNHSVVRLKETWKSLPSRYASSLRSLQDFLSTTENWKSYRSAIKKREVPCLPYLGIFLQDINFLDDGNSNYVDQGPTANVVDQELDGAESPSQVIEPHVNFKKMMLLSNVYKNLQHFQRHPYLGFTSNKNIQTFLDKDMLVLPDKELYEFSKFVESSTKCL